MCPIQCAQGILKERKEFWILPNIIRDVGGEIGEFDIMFIKWTGGNSIKNFSKVSIAKLESES